MYIRTTDGLRQNQTTWPAPETLNRPTVQPTPIHYLGYFNGPTGKVDWDALEKSCWTNRFVVQSFLPNSTKLLDVIRTDIEDIAKAIVRRLVRPLPDLKKLPGLNKNIGLVVHYEGHVDKTTDPKNYGKLDVERAVTVADYLETQLFKEWERKGLGILGSNRLTPGMGPNHPRSSTPRKNRRVEVCFQPYVPTRKGPILLSPGDKII